jgi:beta-lactamase superfamily II metal-dependent hydrolase
MAAKHYTAPVVGAQDFGGLNVAHFWNVYPAFDDENNLSLVTILRYHNLGIIFPGDLERAGWYRLLTRPDFCSALRGVNVFVASHHGRDGGYCPDVFNYCTPEIVIFSDKSVEHDTQKTAALYRQHASGVRFFDGQFRYVITTRNNGAIRISQHGPGVGFVWISRA